MRSRGVSFENDRKLIVCEGSSDKTFISAYCARNGIVGFQYACTAEGSYDGAGGFDVFDKYLSRTPNLAEFQNILDIVLFCDSGDNQIQRFKALGKKINRVKAISVGNVEMAFTSPKAPNVICENDPPRLHILMVPQKGAGGIETLCLRAAEGEAEDSDGIMSAVNRFADKVCVGWTQEKRDKLKLQAFISACANRKPDMTFSQLFDITGDKIIPLDSDHFDPIKVFLQNVADL